METIDTQRHVGELLGNGDEVILGHLHDNPNGLIKPYGPEFQRAHEAAVSRDSFKAPEQLTKGQQASQVVGGIASNLRIMRNDAEKPGNILQEDEPQFNNWLADAA